MPRAPVGAQPLILASIHRLISCRSLAYDKAAAFGMTHNRLQDWHDGNHPGYALAARLRDHKEQVFLFARVFAVDWTN